MNGWIVGIHPDFKVMRHSPYAEVPVLTTEGNISYSIIVDMRTVQDITAQENAGACHAYFINTRLFPNLILELFSVFDLFFGRQ